MTFSDLTTVLSDMTEAFAASVPLTPLACGSYAAMRWPKLLPLMRFSVTRYAAPSFGNVFGMYTNGMGGRMQLATAVFTPNRGIDVPLLLVDVMAFGKKRAAFVEYYDCTAAKRTPAALAAVADAYRTAPDYVEKPAWYIAERAPYSLIKGGADDGQLLSMLENAVTAYAAECAAHTTTSAENLTGLAAFIDRMVREGNPSAATLTRVLGREGAERFFRTAVMPARYQDTAL